MKNQISQRIQDLPASATIAMAERARKLSSLGKDIISLSLGEPDFDTPAMIKQAAKDALDAGYTKYTPVAGLLELREAICRKFERDNDLHYKPENILVSNGAKQCIANVCTALINPGDEIIVPSPFWVSYEQIAELAGAKIVRLAATINDNFKVKASQLEAAITDRTKLIIYSSPCNPTGSVYTEAELSEYAAVLKRNPHVSLLSDEIYEYINYSDRHVTLAQFSDIRDQVIVVNGLSKAFSMTGWRLGYMAAHPELIAACSKVQGQCTSGANAFGQKAAITALDGGREIAAEMYEAFAKRRQLVKKLLSNIPGFKVNDPKGAYYFFADISAFLGRRGETKTVKDSSDFCEYLLEEAGVALVPGIAFGDDNYVRISYAASEATLIEACKRISEATSRLI